MSLESQVMELSPGYRTLADRAQERVGFTISRCQDNSAVIKDTSENLSLIHI